MSEYDTIKEAREKRKMEERYAKNLAGREANVAKNLAEGRHMGTRGIPLSDITSQAAETLGDVKNKMLANKNLVQNTSDIVKTAEGAEPKLLSLASRFPKLKAMLALAGPAAAGLSALSIGNKAMAGDIPGAGYEAADVATDYLPGIGEAKMALSSPELGKGSDIVPKDEEQFDFNQYKTPDSALNEEEKKSKFGGLSKMLGRTKMQQNY